VVWLEDSWKLGDADQRAALRSATGVSDRQVGPLRSAAAHVLGRRLAALPAVGADDPLARLATAKFVSLSGVAGSPDPAATDFGSVAARTLVLGGPNSSVDPATTPAVVAGMVESDVALAVGEVFTTGGDASDRDQWIDVIATDDTLRNHLSTVDDVDRIEGRVAATLVLAELATGRYGNYGLGGDLAVPPNVLTTPLAR
jgi:hypothetical protein